MLQTEHRGVVSYYELSSKSLAFETKALPPKQKNTHERSKI
nr:MAG TPA: hypothetical protein [Caudoviricetes sp.]